MGHYKWNQPILTGLTLGILIWMSEFNTQASTGYAGGIGTENDPYLISTPEELNQLRLDVNTKGMSTKGAYFQITSDIDLSGFDSDSNPNNGNWTPIGDDTTAFEGVLDGRNHKIKALIFNDRTRSAGLFARARGAHFKNLTLENIQISGGFICGGVVATLEGGLIENIQISGDIENLTTYDEITHFDNISTGGVVGTAKEDTTISDVFTDLNVSTILGRTGGIVGYGVYTSLENVHWRGEIKSFEGIDGQIIGGIAGYLEDGQIKKASAQGNILTNKEFVGGIAGIAEHTSIDNIFFKGDVSGSDIVGGIVGGGGGGEMLISNGYHNGNTFGTEAVGGIAGYYTDAALSNVYMLGKVTGGGYVGGIVGISLPGQLTLNASYWEQSQNQHLSGVNFLDELNPELDNTTALSTKEMTMWYPKKFMNELDFDNNWKLSLDGPRLKWESYDLVNQAPTINADDLTLYVDDVFDFSKHASLTDDYEDDLDLIVKDNTVNSSVAGIYTVTYYAIDSFGTETFKTIQVSIKEKPIPIIEANDVVLYVGDIFNPELYATAFDELGKPLALNIIQNTVDTNKEGHYEVTYLTINQLGVERTKRIKVLIKNKPTPVIVAENITLRIGELFNPLSFAKAYDENGVALSFEVIENEVDTSKAGAYNVTFKVVNTFGIETTKTIQVLIKESTPIPPKEEPPVLSPTIEEEAPEIDSIPPRENRLPPLPETDDTTTSSSSNQNESTLINKSSAVAATGVSTLKFLTIGCSAIGLGIWCLRKYKK